MLQTATYVIAGLIIFTSIFLGVKTEILRADGTHANCSFSFSRVQLMWWTVIVASAFIILYGRTGNYDFFNQSTLILLSIGLVTTAGGSIIDTGQRQTTPCRHQDIETQGFIKDILSDENGVSMHRFQALIFNLLFGITFIVTFLTHNEFPEFNNSELALMGVSSGAYLALKTNENKNETALNTLAANNTQTTSSDSDTQAKSS